MSPIDETGPESEETDGLLRSCTFTVQCFECGSLLEQTFTDEDEDWEIPCPECSKKNGRPVFVPVVGYAGAEAAYAIDMLEPGEEEQRPAFGSAGGSEEGSDVEG